VCVCVVCSKSMDLRRVGRSFVRSVGLSRRKHFHHSPHGLVWLGCRIGLDREIRQCRLRRPARVYVCERVVLCRECV
jgi:hypothetical protein